jgi:prepilin-type N-terminal cleavage/methylation domain-containing protein/prepilin-type processing-associated H-X9-DG protein
MPGNPHNSGRSPWAAFTLIELLVVVAIIAILAALLLPVLSRGKKKAIQVNCISNEHQVGTALQLFLNDNNDWLPPGESAEHGLFTGQRTDYMEEATPVRYRYHLVYYLAEHLSLHAPDGEKRHARVFFCPSYNTNIINGDFSGHICYGVLSTNYFKDESGKPILSFNPFGYPPNIYGSVAVRPSRLSAIATEKSLSMVPALADLDQVAIPQDFVMWRSQLPPQPTHGARRNYLFFDNHIAAQPVRVPGTL